MLNRWSWEAYVKMDQRGLIRWLKHADKSYSNMTIRLVSVAAASRSAFKGETPTGP